MTRTYHGETDGSVHIRVNGVDKGVLTHPYSERVLWGITATYGQRLALAYALALDVTGSHDKASHAMHALCAGFVDLLVGAKRPFSVRAEWSDQINSQVTTSFHPWSSNADALAKLIYGMERRPEREAEWLMP